MRVDIYIITTFTGRVCLGNGAYAIVLEATVKGETYRKMHMAGWKELSLQRLQARAVVEAIQYIKEDSDIVIHTSAPYVKNVIESGTYEGKVNSILWSTYFEKAEKMHSAAVLYEKEIKYSDAMKKELAKGQYSKIRDRR